MRTESGNAEEKRTDISPMATNGMVGLLTRPWYTAELLTPTSDRIRIRRKALVSVIDSGPPASTYEQASRRKVRGRHYVTKVDVTELLYLCADG
jgi:hypothetical protein